MGTLIGVAVYLLSFRRAMLVTAVVLAAYALLAILLGRSGWLVDPIYTPVAIVLAAGFSLAARYVLVERERRKVERIFGSWVDPRIAQQLAASRSSSPRRARSRTSSRRASAATSRCCSSTSAGSPRCPRDCPQKTSRRLSTSTSMT
jgi:hypothetical protein